MTMPFDKILFCTDFSEDADFALLTALDMAEKYQARLYVLHVLHSPYHTMPNKIEASERGAGETIFSPELLIKGTEILKERYGANLGPLKNNYEFHVARGVPFVEIIRFARAHQVNYIVLGAAGSSNIERITFGSTAENVARRAHCTVMITRNPEKNL